LRGTGLAVLECEGNSHKLLHSETLSFKPKIDSIACLGLIHQAVAHLIDLWKPHHVSCEATIYVQNFKTAQIMGAARGAGQKNQLLLTPIYCCARNHTREGF
jgi:crossover junction endodeoxyribonuclease RuvC